MMYLTQLKILR